MQGFIKDKNALKAKLSKPTGETSDHKLIALNYAYNFTKTTPKTTTISYESEETE